VQALEKAARPYRITCTVRGVNGVLAAVRAGLGIAVVARSLFPGDFVELPAAAGLPALGQMDLVLLRRDRSASEPVETLTRAILASGNL
jgi:DNA-binding transcriptional LysR family regulator